jgi:hypothetical protein
MGDPLYKDPFSTKLEMGNRVVKIIKNKFGFSDNLEDTPKEIIYSSEAYTSCYNSLELWESMTNTYNKQFKHLPIEEIDKYHHSQWGKLIPIEDLDGDPMIMGYSSVDNPYYINNLSDSQLEDLNTNIDLTYDDGCANGIDYALHVDMVNCIDSLQYWLFDGM